MKSVSQKEEARRPDRVSDKVNGKLSGFFSKTGKIAKVLRIAGTVITVAFTVYSMIPKKDELPGMDNQLYEVVSD
ncbi:MAG: hypothetical protein MJ177_00320 [Clostridia bacterium]|nr:hypothetical protein [Clostridia bacterium]